MMREYDIQGPVRSLSSGGIRGQTPLNKMQFVIQIAYLATVVGALFKGILERKTYKKYALCMSYLEEYAISMF